MVVPRRIRGNRHKLKHLKFDLNMRKNLTSRVTEHWNMLPRQDGSSPSLELFKIHLSAFRCNLL